MRESKKNWTVEVARSELITARKKYDADGWSPIGELKATTKVLKQILDDGEIDYSELDYEEYCNRDYSF